MRTTREIVPHQFETETPHGYVRIHATIEYDVSEEQATERYPNSDLGCPASRTVNPLSIEVERIETLPHGTDDIIELTDNRENRALLYWVANKLWETTDRAELIDIYDWRADR